MPKQNPVLVNRQEDENKQVGKDLVKVVLLNLVFFAILFGLFFFNRTTGKVDHFFSHLLRF
ncbi:MAG: hypothetical protein ACM3KM_00110 [Acidobacteriaceae bacterium]